MNAQPVRKIWSRWVATSCLAASGALWIASLHSAGAASPGGADSLQRNLQPFTLANASSAAIVSAVSKTVASDQAHAGDIVRSAVDARKDLSADILRAAVGSLRDEKHVINCDLARTALEQAISANGDAAASLTDLFVSLAPNCAESPAEGPGGAAVSGLAPGSLGGGSSTAILPCTVCHNNQSIQLACADVPSYLAAHPGDSAGACEATPAANR